MQEPTTPAGPAKKEAKTEEAPHAGPSSTILYIEDNASNLSLLQRILERRRKVKFLTATQGAEGLQLARERRPDLILLDLYLPDVSGHEVLLQLRAAEETASIPVIIISADATSGQAERLLAAGAQAYLTKPLDVPHFLETIDRMLSGVAQKTEE